MASDSLFFGPFRIDVPAGELWRGDERVPIGARALALLSYLLARPGDAITKDELLAQVWEGTHVTPSVLKVRIHEIREALGDSAAAPRYVQTVGRSGYRFVADAEAGDVLAGGRVVGRSSDLEVLERRLGSAVQGRRQIVFVGGEPGIGKSALVELFAEQLRTANVRVATGQCLEQYGEGEPYLPVLDALGRLARGAGGESLRETLHRWAPTWLAHLPALRDRTLEPEPIVSEQRMLREMAEALEAMTAERPLVLVLEDLHWSDAATLALLSYLGRRREPARLVVVGTYRPVEVALRDHPFRDAKRELHGHGLCHEILLELLSPADVEAYLRRRFPHGSLATELAPLVHDRTDGNALFMVSLVDHLVDTGCVGEANGTWALVRSFDSIDVPDGLRHLIARQLEQVAPALGTVLEAASVAGFGFAASTVAAALDTSPELVEQQCDELVTQGHFLDPRGMVTWPDGTICGTYGFRHALYQDVLYARVPPARRARMHRAIGARLEAAYRDRVEAQAAELALHFDRAHDVRRTVHYRRSAAEYALSQSAHREAIENLQRAIELVRTEPASNERATLELELLLALATPLIAVAGYASADVARLYDRAQALCEELGSDERLFMLQCVRFSYEVTLGDRQAIAVVAQRLGELASRRPSPLTDIALRWANGQALFNRGAMHETLALLEEADAASEIALEERLALGFGHDPVVSCLTTAGMAAWYAGRPDHALTLGQRAVALARAGGHHFTLLFALSFLLVVHQLRRELGPPELHDEFTRLSEASGFPLFAGGVRLARAQALCAEGDRDGALREARAGMTSMEATGGELFRPYFLSMLVEMSIAAGDHAEAERALGEAVRLAEKNGETYHRAELERLTGELALARAARARQRRTALETSAGEHFERAHTLAAEQQLLGVELRAALSLGRWLVERTLTDEARTLLSGTYARFTEGLDTPELEATRSLIEELSPRRRAPRSSKRRP